MVHADYSNFTLKNKAEVLQTLLESYKALAVENWVANLSNASSLLWHAYHSLDINVNWTGFYVNNSQVSSELILGPFQGKVACQQIRFGSGVCGTAAASQKTQLVPDVTEFPGHIACDGETKSEIVVPLVRDGVTIGVIDLDCLELQGFDTTDQEYLEQLAQAIVETCPDLT